MLSAFFLDYYEIFDYGITNFDCGVYFYEHMGMYTKKATMKAVKLRQGGYHFYIFDR